MKKKYLIHRARVAEDIVMEFSMPSTERGREQAKAVIICDGMPSVPSKRPLLEFFASKGFWAFHPRYRGTWESDGRFLEHSPEKDIIDVIDSLPKGFSNIWTGERFKLRPKELYVLGGSFGGAAAILASRDKRVTRSVAVAPVVDWSGIGPAEPPDWLFGVLRDAFGNGYRVSRKDWDKLKSLTFYNPAAVAGTIDGGKVLIMHAADDESVLAGPVGDFAHEIGATLIMLAEGGHISLSTILDPEFYPHVRRFMRPAK